jgi:hypothetical protein
MPIPAEGRIMAPKASPQKLLDKADDIRTMTKAKTLL